MDAEVALDSDRVVVRYFLRLTALVIVERRWRQSPIRDECSPPLLAPLAIPFSSRWQARVDAEDIPILRLLRVRLLWLTYGLLIIWNAVSIALERNYATMRRELARAEWRAHSKDALEPQRGAAPPGIDRSH